jgi:diacylglycerol kinase (ATP)
MKHLFVINPMAGKGRGYDIIMPKLKECLAKRDIDNEIYVSQSSDDAAQYSKKWAMTGEHIRIYACGGDGTIYDVVNAVYGFDNVEFAAVPLGSGNDFIRLFGTKDQFGDLDAQIDGTAIKIDAIRCGDQIAVNQCSMGMDAEVCAKQADFKKVPWLTGESAYTASLLYCLWSKRVNHFTITIDDNEPITKDVVFAFCGNSRFYGGGYQAAPYAVPDDGLLDFCIVDTMKIPRLLSQIGNYKKGKHYVWPETTYLRGKKMTVKSEIPAAVNVDGECKMVTESTFEILPNAFNFVIPTNSAYIENRKNGKISDTIGTEIK